MATRRKGDWAWDGAGNRLFVPDVKITKPKDEYLYVPLRGYSGSMAVADINDKVIGWIPVEALGHASVKDWMRVVRFVGYEDAPAGPPRRGAYGGDRKREHLPKEILIRGRRWFQKSYGNTYHTADIVVDGVEIHTTEPEYGYGEGYVETAYAWLQGIVPKRKRGPSGNRPAPWAAARDLGIEFDYYARDVKRERDL